VQPVLPRPQRQALDRRINHAMLVEGFPTTLEQSNKETRMAFAHKIFFTADLHFGHKRITQTGPEDRFRRPFADVDEMNAAIVANWNAVVGPHDKVYVLGDVSLNPKSMPIIGQCNGKKHLIKGNHDIAPIAEYLKYFYEVSAYRVFPEFVASHMPIHPSQLPRFKANVHGHLHEDCLEDGRYVNVSLEQTDYTPISYDAVVARIKKD
jgi:calcineurin-like phosphoesterase family protein